jgi:uncharacterized protein YaaW (UPF0174 family)
MGNSVLAEIELSEDIYAFLNTYGVSKKVIADTSCKLLALKYYQEKLQFEVKENQELKKFKKLPGLKKKLSKIISM